VVIFQVIFSQTLVSLLFCNFTFAQERKVKPADVQKQAIELLGKTAKDADSLKLPLNRLSVLSVVSLLLWKHDEKQARVVIARLEQLPKPRSPIKKMMPAECSATTRQQPWRVRK
jgi:hypothetical protein